MESKASKVVLVNNFELKRVKGKIHVLETHHMSVLVEFLDVKGN